MSLFKSILNSLGIGKDDDKAEAPKTSTPSPKASSSDFADKRKIATARRTAPKSSEMPMVDVVSKLEALAAANPAKLSWKVSIVDLLKLLDIDSSYEARKDLAVELNCPTELMDDSAKMNTWLHKTVLTKISKNGGNIPKELLD